MFVGQELPLMTNGIVKAEQWNAVARIVNILRKINLGTGIIGSITASGVSLSATPSSRIAVVAQPWDITISDQTATLSECCHKHGSVTAFFEDQTADLTDASNTVYVGYAYDSDLHDDDEGVVTVVVNSARNQVIDTAFVQSSHVFKTLLYKLTRTSAVAPWTVASDYRQMPSCLLYRGE